MQIHDVVQGEQEWFDLRVQYPLTASKAQAIASAGKGLETLCFEKMCEKYSSAEPERYSGKDTERGNELEAQARTIYELETGVDVQQVGFVTNESISSVGGASPDGLVGEEGLVEIKCHNDAKHFAKILEMKETGSFKIDSAYVWQMQMQMLFTGRKWCDMVAFNPNYKDSILIVRVNEDKQAQAKIIAGLKIGEEILQGIESKMK